MNLNRNRIDGPAMLGTSQTACTSHGFISFRRIENVWGVTQGNHLPLALLS